MATVTKPIALDESLNTTELAPRNVADVLAEELAKISGAISHIALPTTYDELSDLEDVNITSPTNGQYLQYDSVAQKWKNVNGGGGGGDSVAWSQIVTTGTKIAEITINGTTTDVYAPQGGGGFSALLVITANSGETITATKGGDSYTATEVSSGTYEVSVDSVGTWTVSDGVNSTTVAVSASTTYYVTLSAIPDGSTVVPTDDIQTLLNCADIWDKAYTTIGELLADSTTLALVIADNNAVDYLVRSTTWASSVTSDSTAMTDIGLNNYASNTLLADSTWCNAICNSTYFESVLNVKVPTMTSNTTPSGVCGSTSVYYSPRYEPFKAVGTDPDYGWEPKLADSVNSRCWYQFTSAVKIYLADLRRGGTTSAKTTTMDIIASTDGSTWNTEVPSVVVYSGANSSFNNPTKQVITNPSTADYWGIRLLSTTEEDLTTRNGYKMQFYGRQDV